MPKVTTTTLDPKEEAKYLDDLRSFQDRLTSRSPTPARMAVAAHYQQFTLNRLNELKQMRVIPKRPRSTQFRKGESV